jgi:hypothetical protein
MAEPKRIREKKNLTLNPDGVKKLLAVGAARPVKETNLSRLVDDAIAEYVARHGARTKQPAVSPRDSMLEHHGAASERPAEGDTRAIALDRGRRLATRYPGRRGKIAKALGVKAKDLLK